MDKKPTEKTPDTPQALVGAESTEGSGDSSSHESQDDDDIIVLQEQSRIFSTIHEGDVSSGAYHALKTSYDVIAQRTKSQTKKMKAIVQENKLLQSKLKQTELLGGSKPIEEIPPRQKMLQISIVTRDQSCQTLSTSGSKEIETKELNRKVENLKKDNIKLLEENEKLNNYISKIELQRERSEKSTYSVSQTQTDSFSIDAEKSLGDLDNNPDNTATELIGAPVLPTDDKMATGARPKQQVKSQKREEQTHQSIQGQSESVGEREKSEEEGELTAADLQAIETVNREMEILKEKLFENKDVVLKLVEGFKQIRTIPPKEKKDDVPLAMPIEEESQDHKATIYPPDISSLRMSRAELARQDKSHSMQAGLPAFPRLPWPRADDHNIFYPPVGDEEQPSESRVEAQGETGEQHFVQPVEEGSTPLPPGFSQVVLDMSKYSFHPLPQEMKAPVLLPPGSLEASSLGQSSSSGPRDPGDGMTSTQVQSAPSLAPPTHRLPDTGSFPMERSGSDIRAAMEMASQSPQLSGSENTPPSHPGASRGDAGFPRSDPRVDLSMVRDPPGMAYVPQLPPASVSGQPSSFEEVSYEGAAAAATSAGITLTATTSEQKVCPVCNTVFSQNFPVGDFIAHVNSHFDNDTGDFQQV